MPSILIALIVFAGFGLGIMAIGFTIVVGGAFALGLRIAGPSLIAEAEKRAKPMRYAEPGVEPRAA